MLISYLCIKEFKTFSAEVFFEVPSQTNQAKMVARICILIALLATLVLNKSTLENVHLKGNLLFTEVGSIKNTWYS